jgi:hypothetical protein
MSHWTEWMDERMKELFFLIFGKVEPTVEWYWQGETEELGENLSQCHFVQHKSHWIDPGRRGERPATNRVTHGTAPLPPKEPKL